MHNNPLQQMNGLLLLHALQSLHQERAQSKQDQPVDHAPRREHPARLLVQRLRPQRTSGG